MTIAHYYVDPAIAADSGTGTIGDPYGDLQYAMDNEAVGASGTHSQFNIKAGTDEVLSAPLDLTTFGTPSFDKGIIFRGYTSAANDGGKGGIDGNAGAIFDTAVYGVFFVDLHLHNGGTGSLITFGSNYCGVLQCELDNADGSGVLATGNGIRLSLSGNYFHDLGYGIQGVGVIFANYFKNDGTRDFTAAIYTNNSSAYTQAILENIISIDGASNGIQIGSTFNGICAHNSILSAGGTGIGIDGEIGYDPIAYHVINNLIEGFSGVGGIGIKTVSPRLLTQVSHNAAYNNATNYSLGADSVLGDLGDNESLGASPFAKSGSDTFANRATYFAPVDTGNVHGGAYQQGL